MGPSLSWYRKSYYFYYMSGASAIYLEQGFDQFFKPGPGDHEFQLNPLGRITDEFMRFADKHPDRGTPYTPVAFLLDPAHGWDMTDYPQWPFEVSQINRSDRALRELFGVAYYPGLVVEGEPATGDRQAFVNGVFGDIFDVLVAADVQSPKSNVQRPVSATSTSSGSASEAVGASEAGIATKAGSAGILPATGAASSTKSKATASDNRSTASKDKQWDYEGSNPDGASSPTQPVTVETPRADRPASRPFSALNLRVNNATPSPFALPPSPLSLLDSYRAVVVGGHIEWSKPWVQHLTDYIKSGGSVVVNSAQIKDLPTELLGVRLTGATGEAHNARCLSPGEAPQDLSGQIFRYERVELRGAIALMTAMGGDPLVTVNKVGKGTLIFAAVPDLLGEDERMTPLGAHLLAHVFAEAAPVKVSGDVEFLLNRNRSGWVVTLLNNNGVFKPQQGLAQVDRSAYVTATISLPGQKIQTAVDWITDKELEVKTGDGAGGANGASSVSVSLAPGAVSIIELRTRN
jgi:hypothetical protein